MESEENGLLEFYFSFSLRLLVIIPIFLLVLINLVYHSVLIPLFYIDFLKGVADGFTLRWLIGLGLSPLQFGLYAFPISISILPLLFLPALWNTPRIWGVIKIVIFVAGLVLATAIAGMVSVLSFLLVNFFSVADLSLRWAKLWGAAT